MISVRLFRTIALPFRGTEEMPHFEKRSFRAKKKIFATLDEKNNKSVVKLSAVDQSAFCSFDATVIFPVPGVRGKQGWTTIDPAKVKKNNSERRIRHGLHKHRTSVTLQENNIKLDCFVLYCHSTAFFDS